MKVNRIVKFCLVALAVVLGGAAAVAAFGIPGFGKGEKVKATNGVVTIPLTKVSDGKAHLFTYKVDGKDVSFFVVKAPDGTIKTAFDACDVCYKEKKGYIQDGTSMTCRQCNKKFDTNRIGPHSVGGCNPSYLPSTLTGNNLVIKTADLDAGTRYF
ncbi:MAG: DUF2318 domain-containing protein [Desulfuromonadales bacterium]|nr:MAG: DUF2318 domain-containing protein [Desulfuromonadales bacterium]